MTKLTVSSKQVNSSAAGDGNPEEEALLAFCSVIQCIEAIGSVLEDQKHVWPR